MRQYTLDGGSRTVDLGGGYSLLAPGLRGIATMHEGRAVGTRGPERATPALDEALAAADMHEVRTIELQVSQVPEPAGGTPLRSASGEDAFQLEMPDLGPDVGQILLAVDEAGAVTFNFPLPSGGGEWGGARGGGPVRRFRIRRRIPPAAGTGSERGLVGTLGRKFLKLLVYPLTDPILGPVSEHFAARWEAQNRPYGLRWFTPEDYVQPEGRALTAADWETLAQGPALLFVHGTFSTAHGGFGGLSADAMRELWQRYGGRVFAFNHPTMSQDPRENTEWFLSQIPDGVRLALDIICHSRGGLVSRMLSERPGGPGGGAVDLQRVVFVGTPNRGTMLAQADHMTAMLDRFTTVLNFIPIKAAQELLESVLVALKLVGHGALKGVPGLAAMDPQGQFQARVNSGGPARATYYGITADYEPVDLGLKEFVVDAGIDRIFGEANDLVVPTEGVFKPAHPSFPIPAERLLTFGPRDGVTHVTYFLAAETRKHLLEWLRPEPARLDEVAAGEDPAPNPS